MKWVLLIHLVSPSDQVEYKDYAPLPFETKAECVAAAEAFVDKNPAFEHRYRSGTEVELPVVRSYVECVSAEEYKRRKYGDDWKDR